MCTSVHAGHIYEKEERKRCEPTVYEVMTCRSNLITNGRVAARSGGQRNVQGEMKRTCSSVSLPSSRLLRLNADARIQIGCHMDGANVLRAALRRFSGWMSDPTQHSRSISAAHAS